MLDPAARDYRKAGRRRRSGGGGDPRAQESRREVREAARASDIRRRNSCGRSSATSSTTARITSPTIADNARDVDLALRWGFGWAMGPFETLAGGGLEGRRRLDRTRTSRPARRSRSVPLPEWVSEGPAAARRAHARRARTARRPRRSAPRSTLPVYRRQLFPDPVLGEQWPTGTTIMETPAVRMWHLGDDVAHRVVQEQGEHDRRGRARRRCSAAIERAERECAGLVLWQTQEPFSLGANLAAIEPGDRRPGSGTSSRRWSRSSSRRRMRLRYSLVPTVAAVRGMALGGSCEFILHCDRTRRRARVLHRPGRGRRRPAARRRRLQGARGARGAGSRARRGRQPARPVPVPAHVFPDGRDGEGLEERARGEGAGLPARRPTSSSSTRTSCSTSRRAQARALAEAGLSAAAAAAQRSGRRHAPGIATLEMMLVNMRDGGFISRVRFRDRPAHRARAVRRRGRRRAASSTRSGCSSSSAREFMALLRNAKTQERIAHTLKTGKPLRN